MDSIFIHYFCNVYNSRIALTTISLQVGNDVTRLSSKRIVNV